MNKKMVIMIYIILFVIGVIVGVVGFNIYDNVSKCFVAGIRFMII